MTWLPVGFVHPTSVEVMDGYHLRPIRATDVDLDYAAVMGSRARLWSIFGEAWGWPPPAMTREQDLEDLARHEAEIETHQSFNYALLDTAERLDNLMWLPGTGFGAAVLESFRQVAEMFSRANPEAVAVPAGRSIFPVPAGRWILPKQVRRASRRWAERRFSDIRYWNELDRGGHFTAFEQPELFVGELRARFRLVR